MKINSQHTLRLTLSKNRFKAWMLLLFLIGISKTFAQLTPSDSLVLHRQQFEELFLKQNLFLLAEKYNIDKAEALVLQAKLWPNPSMSISDVNLWATDRQLSNLDEPLPPVFGGFAKNTQFSIQIEQLIQTAGKRRKLMASERVGIEIAEQEFEDVLRELKFDFRNKLIQLQYLQAYTEVFTNQKTLINQLLNNYKKQVKLNNLSKSEFIRLQILHLELSKDLNELTTERNEIEAELKVFLNIDTATHFYVEKSDLELNLFSIKQLKEQELFEIALNSRPDIKRVDLENKQYLKLIRYEKAQVVPDVTIMGGYDRGGGVWPSYFGFGLAIDLPVFNQNQAGIKHAKLGAEQSEILSKEKRVRVRSEINQTYKDLLNTVALYESIAEDYEDDLDLLLKNYTRNFTSRNISLLEYLDFQNAYLENKKIILESQRDVQLQLELLNYTIGKEI